MRKETRIYWKEAGMTWILHEAALSRKSIETRHQGD
jgi:hypothetical protein